MDDTCWYEIVTGDTLFQGNFLLACPSRLERDWPWPLPPDALAMQWVTTDLVVLTQSCNLQHSRIAEVFLAQVASWSTVVKEESARGNSTVLSREFRKKLIEGNIPGLSLLHKHSDSVFLDWSVVNFRRLYSVPLVFLQKFAGSCGPRLRLRSPYREHLAQAFARYFMRVGLPHDAKAFEKEGDAK